MKLKTRINPRYKGLAAHKPENGGFLFHWQLRAPKGKKEIIMGAADVPEWGFKNERMWNYLSEIAKDPKYAVSSSRFRSVLLEAISKFEKKYRKTNHSPEHIVVSAGVAGCYFSLHNVLLSPGDEVLTITPSYYWTPHTNVPYLDAKRVGSPAIEEEGWTPHLEDMRSRISPKTKAIAIVSPVNPTGKVYSKKELKAIVDIAGEFNIPITSDEIEGLTTFDGVESISVARVAGDVPCVTLNSLSKTFGSPGWALGYMCFHDPQGKIAEIEDTVRALAYAYGHSGHRLPTPIMIAAAKAFEEGWWVPDIIQRVTKQREFAWKRLNEIEGVSCMKSMGTFWLFPRVDAIGKTWKTTEEFISELWEEENLSVLSGTKFGKGGFGHFRVTNLPPIGVLEEVYNKLEKFLARHI